MNKHTALVVTSIALLLSIGCAPKYTRINPAKLQYVNYAQGTSELPLQVRAERMVLANSGNARYQKRATKRSLAVVMLELTNRGSSPITLTSDNLRVTKLNSGAVESLSGSFVKQQIKGANGLYFLWALLWVGYRSTTFSSTGGTTSSGFFLPIGLPIGLGNFIGAEAAAKNLGDGLEQHRAFPLTIEPGKSAYVGYYFFDPYYSSSRFTVEVKQDSQELGRGEF